MTVSQEQWNELEKLGKPIAQWIQRNGTPHVKVIIEDDHMELVSGERYFKYGIIVD